MKVTEIEMSRKVLLDNRKIKDYPAIPAQGFIYLRPVNEKISNRPKLFPDAKTRLMLRKNTMGAIVTNHTQEEMEEIMRELPINFWDNFIINLPHRGRKYDVTSKRDMLEYRMIFLFNVVAPNRGSVQSHHLFFIENVQQESKEINIKSRKVFEALKKLYEMSNTDKIQFLSLYDQSIDNVTAEIAEAKLNTFISRDPEKFLEFLSNSNDTYNLIVLKTAIQKGVIKQNPKDRTFHYESIMLGRSEGESLEFLKNKKNQAVKLNIMESSGIKLE